MLRSIRFENFRVLRDATLPVGEFTLLIGPNGSGKTTAIQALEALAGRRSLQFPGVMTAGLQGDAARCLVELRYEREGLACSKQISWSALQTNGSEEFKGDETTIRELREALARVRSYSLRADELSDAPPVDNTLELSFRGQNLASVLHVLKLSDEGRFHALERDLVRAFPEFSGLCFGLPGERRVELRLRQKSTGVEIPSQRLSAGTLLFLSILALAYQPQPPSFLAIEEPEVNIHRWLLPEIRDAFYRLAYPMDHGESRAPVQVLVTTHSPYLLDLYKDHPKEVVIADRDENGARFRSLTDMVEAEEILQGAALGELWHSGVLGGVPRKS